MQAKHKKQLGDILRRKHLASKAALDTGCTPKNKGITVEWGSRLD